MSAVMVRSVPQMVATFDRRARHSAPKPHTPHEACETRSDLWRMSKAAREVFGACLCIPDDRSDFSRDDNATGV